MKSPKFNLRGFRGPREVAQHAGLGKLEREVMEELWRRGTASLQEVYQTSGERSA